jgi:hypothetical protein
MLSYAPRSHENSKKNSKKNFPKEKFSKKNRLFFCNFFVAFFFRSQFGVCLQNLAGLGPLV